MILYYAMGGGLGHLTRARAVAHTLGFERDVTVLTASVFADDARVRGQMTVARVPDGISGGSPEYHAWLAEHLTANRLDLLIIDAFPGGLFGELCGTRALESMDVWHVARRIQWNAYAPRLRATPPRFAVTWMVERLDAEQKTFLDRQSDAVVPLTLFDPPVSDVRLPADLPDPFWVIAHAGPPLETNQLIAYAVETRAVERSSATLLVVAPHAIDALPAQCHHVDVYPATALFRRAERVFTAAGFNSVRQMAPWRGKHWMLPFPRPLDDQYARKRALSDGYDSRSATTGSIDVARRAGK